MCISSLFFVRPFIATASFFRIFTYFRTCCGSWNPDGRPHLIHGGQGGLLESRGWRRCDGRTSYGTGGRDPLFVNYFLHSTGYGSNGWNGCWRGISGFGTSGCAAPSLFFMRMVVMIRETGPGFITSPTHCKKRYSVARYSTLVFYWRLLLKKCSIMLLLRGLLYFFWQHWIWQKKSSNIKSLTN